MNPQKHMLFGGFLTGGVKQPFKNSRRLFIQQPRARVWKYLQVIHISTFQPHSLEKYCSSVPNVSSSKEVSDSILLQSHEDPWHFINLPGSWDSQWTVKPPVMVWFEYNQKYRESWELKSSVGPGKPQYFPSMSVDAEGPSWIWRNSELHSLLVASWKDGKVTCRI